MSNRKKTETAARINGCMRKHNLLLLILIWCFLPLLSSCGGTTAKAEGPHGFYANEELYIGYEFDTDMVTFRMLTDESKGTWTMEGDEVKISFDEGTSDTLTYDAENDSLNAYGTMELKKMTEEEYSAMREKGEAMGKAIESLDTAPAKKYFDERPEIETPDSIDSSIKFEFGSDGSYFYSLGFDADESKILLVAYMAYLEEEGYQLEDVSDSIKDQGGAGAILKKNGKSDGNIVFAQIEDVGYALGVTWY